MRRSLNIIGPQVRKYRNLQRYTLEEFAGACQLIGFNISAGILSQVESQTRSVTDLELYWLARALKVEMTDLLPPSPKIPQWQQRRPS